MRHRRCLVPATGYYEWSGRRNARAPHLIRSRTEGVLALAGLWEHWLGADGSEIETMAVLTVPATQTLASIHDRMPVILAPADFDAWLDCRSGSTTGGVLDLLVSVAPEALTVSSLGPAVNDVGKDGPEVWSPRDDRLL
jgi:putative SOS response-associated peptidase YedK